jgi:hypothetical protein
MEMSINMKTFNKVWNDLCELFGNSQKIIHTLTKRKPNTIISISNDGIVVKAHADPPCKVDTPSSCL